MKNEEKRNDRAEEIKGKYNLEMGIHLAWEDFIDEMAAMGQDDSQPEMSREKVEDLLAAVNAERNRIKTKQKITHRCKRIVRWSVSVAASLIIVFFMAYKVDASRTTIVNYIIQNFDDYSRIRYGEDCNALPPVGWRNKYYPGWIPEGYRLDSVRFSENDDYIWYKSERGKEFTFHILASAEQTLINSEECEKKVLRIKGKEGILYWNIDRRYVMLFLPLFDCSLQIDGNISEMELCKIAESIKNL